MRPGHPLRLSFGFGNFCFSLTFSQPLGNEGNSRVKDTSGGGISRSSSFNTNVLPINSVGLGAIWWNMRTHSSPDSSSHQSMRLCRASTLTPLRDAPITGEMKFARTSATSPGLPCTPPGKSNTSTWPYRRSSPELGSSPYAFYCSKEGQHGKPGRWKEEGGTCVRSTSLKSMLNVQPLRGLKQKRGAEAG